MLLQVVSVGPTSIVALIVAVQGEGENGHTSPQEAVILSVLAGLFQLLLGLFKAGMSAWVVVRELVLVLFLLLLCCY